MKELFTHTDVAYWRQNATGRIGLVPTMGSLHAGHMHLVEAAHAECDTVIASVFVNPLQFGPDEDYEAYPRDYASDRDQLAAAGVDGLFAPSVDTMYPRGLAAATVVDVPGLTDILCGAHRPGHFRGVVTVVAKLFNRIRPHLAFFGEKDFQQLAVIRRMADDLATGVEVRGVAVDREPDGLARSSRNAYLNDDQRQRAAVLYHALLEARDRLTSGSHDIATIEEFGRQRLSDAGFQVDYFTVRAVNLNPPDTSTTEFRVLAAGWLGRARLIDNLPASR